MKQQASAEFCTSVKYSIFPVYSCWALRHIWGMTLQILVRWKKTVFLMPYRINITLVEHDARKILSPKANSSMIQKNIKDYINSRQKTLKCLSFLYCLSSFYCLWLSACLCYSHIEICHGFVHGLWWNSKFNVHASRPPRRHTQIWEQKIGLVKRQCKKVSRRIFICSLLKNPQDQFSSPFEEDAVGIRFPLSSTCRDCCLLIIFIFLNFLVLFAFISPLKRISLHF